MAIERIPCGGWDIDNTTIAFVESGSKKVLGVIAGSQSDPSKLPLTGGTMLGPIELTSEPTENMQVANKEYVDKVQTAVEEYVNQEIDGFSDDITNIQSQVDGAIKKDGTTVTTAVIPFAQGINLNNQKATNMAMPNVATDGANKQYVDNTALNYLKLSGGAMAGQVNMGGNSITNLSEPNNPQDAATKAYVDAKFIEALITYRIRDLFGVPPRNEQTIILPDKRDNVAVVYYSVDPDGGANISNSRAITVPAGQTVEGNGGLTVKFSDDMVTLTIINGDSTNSILGQYYGYNTQ